jgi:hypothetical protein
VKAELVRPTLPPGAAEPCAAPVALPDRKLTERETTTYWGRDRAALRTCETRRAALVQAIEGEP